MAGPCVLLPVVLAIFAHGIFNTMPIVFRQPEVSRSSLARKS
jgi:hypothetical protein